MDSNDIRCVDCNKKLAEYLYGTAVFTCKRCRKRIYIDTRHNNYSYAMILTGNQENGTVSVPHPV